MGWNKCHRQEVQAFRFPRETLAMLDDLLKEPIPDNLDSKWKRFLQAEAAAFDKPQDLIALQERFLLYRGMILESRKG